MRKPRQPGSDGRVAYYAARNHADHTPAAVLVFDTETSREQVADGELQRLRLWCARYVQRREQERRPARDERHWGHTATELAQVIDGHARGIGNIWVWAHNLGYDVQASGILPALAALGWHVSAVSSMPARMWLAMVQHKPSCPQSAPGAPAGGRCPAKAGCRRLTFADTVSLWPMPLAEIGALLGKPKLPMPGQDADEPEWVRYCMRDVDVTTEALLTLLDHWDVNKLGRFAITSGATGFNTLRHTMPGRTWLVVDDDESSAWDRAATYGGRRQAWQHGQLPPGRYAELDFTAAHATVGANMPLPVRRGEWFDHLPVDDKRVDHKLISCIAECEIETDVPRFPVRVDGAVDYPVGRFTTILCGPEIAWARELGCLRRIGRGQWHLLDTRYQPFFQQVLDLGRPGESPCPPVVSAVWKHFGRTVIGKFAQRGYRTECTGTPSDEVLKYETEMDWETEETAALIHYGGWVWRISQEGDGKYAYPAVTAFVQSHVRVALGKAIEMTGTEAMVLCDTDGMWVDTGVIEAGRTGDTGFALGEIDRRARAELLVDVLSHQLRPFTVREKNVSQRMRLAGPQIYDTGTTSKAAGRPRNLERADHSVWTGMTFPSFFWQQQHAEPGVYRTQLEEWQWPATRIRGWCLADGRVLPLRVRAGPGGQAAIVPWDDGSRAPCEVLLAPVQHPALEGLWDPVKHTSQEVAGDSSIWERSAEDARQARDDRRRTAGIARPQDGVRAVLAEEGTAGGPVPERVGPGEHAEAGP